MIETFGGLFMILLILFSWLLIKSEKAAIAKKEADDAQQVLEKAALLNRIKHDPSYDDKLRGRYR